MADREEFETDPSPGEETGSRRLQFVMSWVLVVILTTFGSYLLIQLATIENSPEAEPGFWDRLLTDQFPVLVGVPLAGLGALFVTLILRISTGPLEFEILGLKFKGGAAPIVFWVICFLSIVTAIKLLWQTT